MHDHPADERLDELKRLWTPWRMAYILGPGEPDGRCPFCAMPERPAEKDAETLIVHRGETSFVVLNAYPYNPGHVMVVPYRHTADLDDLGDEEADEITALTRRAIRALRASTAPHGFNIGINMGAVAGAGIADHLHQHVIPRWGGDTNFMPVIGQTKVLPELLEETYSRLAPAFAAA